MRNRPRFDYVYFNFSAFGKIFAHIPHHFELPVVTAALVTNVLG
jgi:hypothetical protein